VLGLYAFPRRVGLAYAKITGIPYTSQDKKSNQTSV